MYDIMFSFLELKFSFAAISTLIYVSLCLQVFSFLCMCTSKFLFLASSMDKGIEFLHYSEVSIFSIFWVDNGIELLFLASKILLLPLNASFKTSSQR